MHGLYHTALDDTSPYRPEYYTVNIAIFFVLQLFSLGEYHGNSKHIDRAKFAILLHVIFKGPSHMPIAFLEGREFFFKSDKRISWDEYDFEFIGDCKHTVGVSIFLKNYNH